MVQKNIRIDSISGKPVVADLVLPEGEGPFPVVVYAHGFAGFKDWGRFDLIADWFRQRGMAFIKFNFSHNGTSPIYPEEFVDLPAFGEDNYSKQLQDLGAVINWLCRPDAYFGNWVDTSNISLIGHSKGGAVSIVYAAMDKRITRLITWAAVSHCRTPWDSWDKEKIAQWQMEGVQYYKNGRTGQMMPLNWQLYEDYQQHKEQLDVEKAIASLEIPVLICHGTLDSSVPPIHAENLCQWQPKAKKLLLETDHVFGRRHPWPSKHLPEATRELVEAGFEFIKEAL